MNKIEELINKYSQSNTTKLTNSIIRIFQAVIESSKKIKQSNLLPETNQMLDQLIYKLSEYLNQKELNVSEYYGLVKNLITDPAWKNVDSNDKVKLITKPLEIAYQWLNRKI